MKLRQKGFRVGLLGWDQDTPGDKTQRGVVAVSYLLIAGMFLCSILLAQSIPDGSDVSGLGVGLTAFLLFGAAAAVGAGLGFLFGLPRGRYADLGGSNDSGVVTGKTLRRQASRGASTISRTQT